MCVGIVAKPKVLYPRCFPGLFKNRGGIPAAEPRPRNSYAPAWGRPSLLGPGDAVCFKPIDLTEFRAIQAAVANNAYTLAGEELTA